MIALSVSLQVLDGHREDFLEAIYNQAQRSFSDEPGCVYFDVTCSREDDHHFVLYELYEDENALQAHRHASHFAQWRAAADRCVVPGSQVNVICDQLVHHA